MRPPRSGLSRHFPREMRRADVEQVASNEAAVQTRPWTARTVMDCLMAGYECWVMASGRRVVAHGVLAVGDGECHLLTLCVRPDCQRRGYGRKLLGVLLDRARRLDASVCRLEVSPSNERAVGLYRAMGFAPDPGRQRTPSGRAEAVQAMSRPLDDPPAAGAAFR